MTDDAREPQVANDGVVKFLIFLLLTVKEQKEGSSWPP